MYRQKLTFLLLSALALSQFCTALRAEDEVDAQIRKADRAPAPELAGASAWLNTDGGKPVTIADLKGKVVLLDFWTFGCINCMHIIPDLKKLEKKYSKEL